MGFDHAAAKRPVTVTLNEDLLRQAERHTADLSNTLEILLADFVSRREPRQRDDDEAVAQLIAAANARYEKYGLLSEELQDF